MTKVNEWIKRTSYGMENGNIECWINKKTLIDFAILNCIDWICLGLKNCQVDGIYWCFMDLFEFTGVDEGFGMGLGRELGVLVVPGNFKRVNLSRLQTENDWINQKYREIFLNHEKYREVSLNWNSGKFRKNTRKLRKFANLSKTREFFSNRKYPGKFFRTIKIPEHL